MPCACRDFIYIAVRNTLNKNHSYRSNSTQPRLSLILGSPFQEIRSESKEFHFYPLIPDNKNRVHQLKRAFFNRKFKYPYVSHIRSSC